MLRHAPDASTSRGSEQIGRARKARGRPGIARTRNPRARPPGGALHARLLGPIAGFTPTLWRLSRDGGSLRHRLILVVLIGRAVIQTQHGAAVRRGVAPLVVPTMPEGFETRPTSQAVKSVCVGKWSKLPALGTDDSSSWNPTYPNAEARVSSVARLQTWLLVLLVVPSQSKATSSSSVRGTTSESRKAVPAILPFVSNGRLPGHWSPSTLPPSIPFGPREGDPECQHDYLVHRVVVGVAAVA